MLFRSYFLQKIPNVVSVDRGGTGICLISSLIIFLCAFSGFLKERLQASLRKGDERRAARAKLAEEQKGGAQK